MSPKKDGTFSQWPTLHGYTITEQLYSNARTVVYRALSAEPDQPGQGNQPQKGITGVTAAKAPQPVVIKVLQQSHPSFQDLVKFRHQYAITKDLPIPGITRPISLDPWQNGYALIMEDFGGISLQQYVKDHSLSLIDVLAIGIQIADILNELAAHQLVHKDIKPANILIHPHSKQVKLTDFSISSLLPKETQNIQHPHGLEGTLAYLAPEQTGRMNRGIDYRADFYALGVTLYELLCEQLPFQETDPIALVHAHIAQQPVSPSQRRSEIPSMVSAVVLKLMRKNAEERYQSAFGLKHDLEKCLHSWKDTGSIQTFELGIQDRCDRFTLPEKLYGRATEVSTLLNAFARTAHPNDTDNSSDNGTGNSIGTRSTTGPELVLVAGHSGIGKTAVIQEIHKPITRQQGYFIQGKFDQFNRETPFSAFVAAFRNLMEQLLCEPDAALNRWRKRLLAAVGAEAQLIIEVIPELATLLGSQHAVTKTNTETSTEQSDAELSGAEAQARFHQVFVQFVRVFAQPAHPLVIFLDDLQWADAASLQLIQVLIADNPTPYLLTLGAYRDNEVSPAHPLMLTLGELEKRNTTIHTLTLAPLPLEEVNRLVADTLHTSITASEPLAQLIYQKTKGNPFFTTQLLKGLNEEGYITYQASTHHDSPSSTHHGNTHHTNTGHWTCNLSQVRQHTTTDDVVTFVVSRLQKLPETTQTALKLAACLGNRFELHTLSLILQSSPQTVATQLWPAMQEGFLTPKNEVYKIFQDNFQDKTVDSADSINRSDTLTVTKEVSATTPAAPDNLTKSAPTTASYQFLHDRVQQAAYLLIPESQRPATHENIGQQLLQHLSPQKQQEALFEIVNHLNIGQQNTEQQNTEQRQTKQKQINQQQTKQQPFEATPSTDAVNPSDTHTHPAQLSQLNLAAGKKAMASTAYTAAIKYLEAGINALPANAWSHQYPLAFSLHHTLCASQLNDAQYDQLSQTIVKSLTEIHDPMDRAEIYVIQVVQKTLQGQYEQAIQSGLLGLSQLGINVDQRQLADLSSTEFSNIVERLQDRPIDTLLELPTSVPAEIQAAIKLLISLDPPTYIMANMELYRYVSLKAVSLSMEHGNISDSIKAYANYGLLLGLMKADYQQGYEFAELALKLSYQLNSKSQRCKASLLLGGWIHVWARPIAGAANVNYQGFLAGIESGESQFAAYNLFATLFNRLFQGENLADVTEDIAKFWTIAEKIQDALLLTVLASARIFSQKLCLSAKEQKESTILIEAETIINQGKNSQSWFSTCLHYILQMQLAYLTNEIEVGLKYATAADPIINSAAGFTSVSDYYYYGALLLLGHYPSCDKEEQQDILKTVESHLEQLNTWAQSCPENFLHKMLLIQAERDRAIGNTLAALDNYDAAIAQAGTHHYTQDEALANELATKFCLDWGKEKIAAMYLKEAYYGYVRWGALAKVRQLEHDYPQLLTNVLQAQQLTPTLNSTLTVPSHHLSSHPFSSHHLSSHHLSSHQSARHNGHRKTEWLDLTSAMQAARAISQEIELDKLLGSLVRISVANAGAQTGHLILQVNGQWMVTTRTVQNKTETLNLAIDQCTDIPKGLIYSTLRTEKTQVFENLSQVSQFNNEPDIVARQPKSVMCIPIHHKGHLVGLLYLENNLAVGAFTRDRIELLQLLTSQAAISIENARLYQQTENYALILKEEVAYKTQALNQKAKDLEQALTTLKKTQAQLIHAGKMSSMEQLVAGVAHEINNPITFIQGNISAAQHHIEDIVELLALYQELYPQPHPRIQEKQADLEIEFVAEDVVKILGSMAAGSDRIRQIVLNLRSFSRLDESERKSVNLQHGIESTLLILQSRFQPTQHHPEIKVLQTYRDLPNIMCEPRQLNQVFLNILTNAIEAIHATDNRSRTSLAELNEADPTITILTEVTSDQQLRIVIANNGQPIPADVQEHIFNPFFTTKAVGSGTGLGLFVSHSVVQKHGGTLTLTSDPAGETAFEILLPQTVSA